VGVSNGENRRCGYCITHSSVHGRLGRFRGRLGSIGTHLPGLAAARENLMRTGSILSDFGDAMHTKPYGIFGNFWHLTTGKLLIIIKVITSH
jgi:hypothetical protein